MQGGVVSKPLVHQGSGTFKGLFDTVLVILGGCAGCSHEYPTLIRRSCNKISMGYPVWNGAACNSHVGEKGPR